MTDQPPKEWFDAPDPDTGEIGLRFQCTQCGNCCSGGPGTVLMTDDEAAAIASRLGLEHADFIDRYTHLTRQGRSLKEVASPRGLDCILLDRTSIPGKAICSVYEDRPSQCRSWPFWNQLTRSRLHWVRAKADCPGLDQGRLYSPDEIRITRSKGDL